MIAERNGRMNVCAVAGIVDGIPMMWFKEPQLDSNRTLNYSC